jgi:hypothetical protein
MLTLKNKIEEMPKFHQIEILRILKDDSSVYLNENNNGTFINLTEQSKSVIEKLEEYTEYVEKQQQQLNKDELEKNRIENAFFKDKKKTNIIL